ncbi:Rhombotin-1 Cysteine-rich protein TTG-1 LIM domain only protein 1 [Takifugu flavidus]|uniref:Rhombotin-1 Cysteine-rich protein TTG-1 LIM domain only protein 1 n=1 Tax=Takifugu flavidus TaxID=433684 RepID=A0A5C6P8P6_9TELE|nr:Rhombotin-1 Cysteine-rich protein TTG-1 LIM domain only protein 1 [Takifugu flavidus]
MVRGLAAPGIRSGDPLRARSRFSPRVLRLFGVTGNCAACSKMIPAFEMVMRARDNVYHLDCFACQLCRHRFCVGDKFFLKNNMILCQLDYEGGHLSGSGERPPQSTACFRLDSGGAARSSRAPPSGSGGRL